MLRVSAAKTAPAKADSKTYQLNETLERGVACTFTSHPRSRFQHYVSRSTGLATPRLLLFGRLAEAAV